jgi:hypothetical protein
MAVLIEVCKTEQGYCAGCDLLPGWVVAINGNFAKLQNEVRVSIDLFVEWAKEDGDEYPAVFDGDYSLEFVFNDQEE